MNRRVFIRNTGKLALGTVFVPFSDLFNNSKFNITVDQITGGKNHHFFGYIGQSLTIPWNYNGDKILCMSSPFHDHLPGRNEAATLSIIDPNIKSGEFNKIEKLDVEWVHVIYLPPHPSKNTGTALNYVEIRLRGLTFHLHLAVIVSVLVGHLPLSSC